ncbi:hypothetical protein CVT26_005462 [Gymnopilus dilepis]|uniref:Lipoyl-binding domain-containing protein n=1 Tax=Gymnopilus dilepis TaxID=231916 RepID=A0A409YTA1_9AGAR|nr:hypothetical protein CVT26_005462 [Gymnopilus dilepis]
MSAFNTLSKASSAVQTRVKGYGLAHYKRRWLHESAKRNAILMPAMSPLMTEGTITRWKKKEGEAFAAGDVLLQIESDLYAVDVQAQRPGIMGKILMPDGTSNVPVEQVIALVAQDAQELASLRTPSSSSPRSCSSPAPSSPLASPRHPAQFNIPLSSPRTPTMTTRRLSLFEMHTTGYGQRSLHAGVPLPTARMLGSAPCPSPPIQQQDSPDHKGRK